MHLKQLNEGPCRTYLIGSEKSRQAALVDPVLDRVDEYLRLLKREKWRLACIIDTHTHADHISGGPALRDRTQAPYVMDPNARAKCPNHRVRDGERLKVGDVTIRVLATPGHTNDSITLVVDGHLLTGDFLFIGDQGAGRTDLPTGDAGEHFESLQKLKEFSDKTIVLPAHDYEGHAQSTMGAERTANLRLRFTSKQTYRDWLKRQAQPTPEWMLKVVQENYACSQRPGKEWIPVDSPMCAVGGSLTLGVDGQQVRTMTPEEAKRRIEGTGALALDVREPDEYTDEFGHVPGSRLIPVGQVAHRLGELEEFRGKEIITICRSGGRSLTAAAVLMQAGFGNVASMSEGMMGWNLRKYPIEREARPSRGR
ncbi:MAG: MBL fold metallo-hydrolase [Chloroflexi bacterium]|nr:MBL fold metallo-hydrolase [Chloroflexota bacterium]